MAVEQRRIGCPGDESVSGLQLGHVPLITGTGTILCDAERFVWPDRNKDVKSWARSCLSCQRNKVRRHQKSPPGTFPSSDARFSHVHLDVVGPLPPSNCFTHLLTCVDRYTRWADAIPLSNMEADTTTIRRNRHYRDVVDRVQSTGPSRKSRRTPSATGLLGVLHVSSSSSGSSGGCSSSSSKLIAFPSSGSAVTTAAATDGGDDCIRGCTPLASGNYSHLDQTTGSVASRQRRQPGRRNPPHHYPQQHSSSPGVPFFALNIITRLIHLELHLPDRVSPDGETLVNFAKCRSRCDIVEKFLCHQRHPYPFKPDPHIQQSLSHLHPFALPEISSTEDFEHRMFKLSKGYEPGESGVPPAAVERRLSKEAIQAANSLASQTIAQKLTPASVRAFKVLCGQVQYPSGTATAVGSANAFIKLDRISPRVSSPVHGALTTSPPSGEPSSPVSVVNSLWQTRLAQHRENQAHGGQKCQSPAPARPASSPTVSVAHQHSQSDSQVQTYSSSSDDRFSFPLLVDKRFGDDRSASLPIDACETPPSNTLPNRGHFNSRRNDSPYQRPPPLPPRRRSATRSTAASSNPTPVCIQQEAPTATRLPVTAVLEGEDDADLPPLPPKSVGTSTAFQRARPLTREQTTSSPVSPLFSNPSRQAELFASHQLLFGGEGTVDCRPPPLPPRRHVSGPAASNVLLQPTVRLP
ncbi:unnamed protein product [Schistocephalus solidus]|uniref:Integrase_H2C2 domain-containing protein n=1 Tax=Schistocephalus solidus TaxID=70667 RepID=A0A183TFG1_SCHSO|nr:unnamed protein product [Schistocephalus solidus]